MRSPRTAGSSNAALRLAIACCALLGADACALFQAAESTPEDILARIETPQAPVLSPGAAAASFRLAPGFRIELVAAEPLVEDPVAIDWDDAGRMFAVEMRGYMPNIEGTGEDVPNGRIVVLEDRDGDGRMDASHVYLEGLVLPRAIAVLPEGVLIGEPPNLWLCRDTSPDDAIPHCDQKQRVGDYGVDGMNPEHNENALLRGVDGRIYNARSYRRFVFDRDAAGAPVLSVEPAVFRGQWGLDQDEDGTFFYNTNSTVLLSDTFDSRALLRHPVTTPAWPRLGVSEQLMRNATIHSVRVNPGLNRAYSPGELRPDGRLQVPTAISGLALYRGDQFGSGFASQLGPDTRRHLFVPEPGANVVLHVEVEKEPLGIELSGSARRYADPIWKEREFVASTDERFRPVDAEVGPDGALYLVDMYRGVIQHSTYVSDYLAKYVADHGLSEPLGLGRIWRVVRDEKSGGAKLRRRVAVDMSRTSTDARLAGLSHANAWQRERAQQWLVHDWRERSGEGLRQVANHAGSASARVRALWALEQRDGVDFSTWMVALRDREPSVRIAGLRTGRKHLRKRPRRAELAALETALADPAAGVSLQAVLSADPKIKKAAKLVRSHVFERWDDELLRQAYLSTLAEVEADAIHALVGEFSASRDAPTPERAARFETMLADLTQAWFTRLHDEDPAAVAGLLELIEANGSQDEDVARGMLAGLANAASRPGFEPAELPAAHRLLDNAALQPGQPFAAERTRARKAVTWPGDDFVPGLSVLTPEQVELVEAGRALYSESCAVCHGAQGTGLPGVAPTLAGTAYVNDADDWLVRIALQGLRGPVKVRGQHFDAVMPGHGQDARFDDASLANVLSFVRRSWGNGGRWIDADVVRRVRAETSQRVAPWTVAELAELDVEHALDRFAGRYTLSGLPMSFKISRSGVGLSMSAFAMGTTELERVDRMKFRAVTEERGAVGLEFMEDGQGGIDSFLLEVGAGQRITAQRDD